MGGGCVCDNYLQKCCQNPNQNHNPLESKISLEEYQDEVPQNNCNYNQITKKTTNILYNILENNQVNKKISKRYSDYNSNNLRYSNFKQKKMKNDIKGVPNTTLEEASYLNNPNNNNNEDTNINKKLITSNPNSSNLNESTLFPSNNNNTNINHDKRNRYNNVTKIINDKNRIIAKQSSETLINYNMGENNFIFINIHRGKQFMNTNKMEKIESVTPKMIMEKDNLENITNGPKNLFSHIVNTRMNNYNNNNNSNQQLDFNTNRLSFLDMNRYSEEMLNIINSIRTNPESFIKEINYIINNNIKKTEEGIFLISHEVDEKIKLMDNYIEIFTKTKKELINIANSKEKRLNLQNIIYNDNLEIILDESCLVDENNDLDESSCTDDIQNIPAKLNLIYDDDDDAIDYGIEEEEIKSDNLHIVDFDSDNEKEESPNNKKNNRENKKIMDIKNNNIKNRHISYKSKKTKKKRNINNYLDLEDDQIANLILQKRKEILCEYPHNVFKLSVIKDIKISILIELAMEEMFKDKDKGKTTTLKEIIFNPLYKHFAVSWANEINRNFIAISCFA